MERLTLKAREERRLLRGHLWAYRNEFKTLPALADGKLVDVMAEGGRFVGRGYYQAQGGIAVRLLTMEKDTIDGAFFTKRLADAAGLRGRLFPGAEVYRWVHGESDGLPGLIIDRYGPLAVVQTQATFYETWAEAIAEALQAHEGVGGVHFTGPGGRRDFGAAETPVAVRVHGLSFQVNPGAGQKTGLFLDQRVNWTLLEPFAKGARVLDGHCYRGAWSLHAAKYGAKQVLGVDTSAPAIEAARQEAVTNGFGEVCAFELADIREVLAREAEYDVVVLDPPALAKARDHVKKALGVYHALNRDAIKRLAPGGVLITSSCSHFVDLPEFMEMLKRASNSARRQARILDIRGAAPDHPVLLSMPETAYLKCVVLQVE